MTTVTLWVLIALGGYSQTQAVVIDRFATLAECDSAREAMTSGAWLTLKPLTRCVQMKVAR